MVAVNKVTFNDLTPDEQDVYALAAQRLLDGDDGDDDDGPCEVCATASPDHKSWCPLVPDEPETEEV